MPAVNLDKYLDKSDQHGVKVSSWAVQIGPSVAECKVCVPARRITFKKGIGDLTRHSETELHRQCMKSNKASEQPTLFQFAESKENNKLNQQSSDLEIALCVYLSRHDIPPRKAADLVEILKKYVTDSKIIENVKLSDEKARYLTIHGLGKQFESETIKKLQKCDAFSCSIDESEVNKRSVFEIQVKIASEENGLESRHFEAIDLPAGDAGTITETLLETFKDNNIDYKQKLINVGMDGCNTMMGNKTGVMTRLKSEIPQIKADGSCNLHHMGNTAQHATTAFNPDIKQALVDTYFDLGGAVGKGLKKQKEFIKICKEKCGFEPQPILEFVSTRWLSLPTCIKPILHNYIGIVKYYESLKKPTERQERLKKFYVERCDITRIRLKFLLANFAEFTKNIKFFEDRNAHVHNVGDKLEDILVSQYSKILDDSEYNELDANGDLTRKSREELINIDLEKAKKLSSKEMFLGQEVEKEIKDLGLKPNMPQMSWLIDSGGKFHLEACKYLQKYFKTTLSNPVINYLSGLDPSAQSNVTTPSKLKQLVQEYSKVVYSIQFAGGMDAIKGEIDKYVTDEAVKDLPKDVGLESFWTSVKNLKEGSSDWKRYDVLPRFALCMATRYDANAEVERSFSLMNLIHQNTQRNRMTQETLNAHLHVRSKVESKETREGCEKCETSSKDHCHCTSLVITEDLREQCKKSWKVLREVQLEANKTKDNFAEKSVKIKEKVIEDEKVRIENFGQKVKGRTYFCKEKHFEPIYRKKKKVTTDSNHNKVVKKLKRPSSSNNNASKSKKSKPS